MDVTKNELGNILAEKGFKNTAFYHFAQKLFLINPNFNQDDVVFIIEGLSEEMKTKIVSNYKKDKLNGVSGEDIEKKINEYDSQFLDEANPAEPEISDDADVTGEEIEINPADNNEKKEEKNVDSINVQIVGEVKVPGAFKVKQGTTVSELIDVAGGLTDAADQAFIPFLKVLEAEEKIEVPVKLIKVYIHGGVKNEGIFNIPSNGSIDDAVRMADGFSDTADPSMIDYTIKLKDGCNITIPEKFFPLNNDKINDLRNKTLVNLTGMTNTDLKLKYGILNFKKLSEYDDNFTKFVSMLPDYYNRLKEAGYESLANELLEFAVEQGADSKNVYSLLANAFISMSKADRLAELIEKAKQLNSLSRDGIVSMLESLQADTAPADN